MTRVKSLMFGSAKDKPIIWHRDHRTKKNKNKSREKVARAYLYREKKRKITEKEILEENLNFNV